jgi:hypothetical protein
MRDTNIRQCVFFYSCFSHLEHRASVKRFVSLQFLHLRESVGLLWQGISPSQGRYLTQTQNKRRLPCLEWDWNPRSQCSSSEDISYLRLRSPTVCNTNYYFFDIVVQKQVTTYKPSNPKLIATGIEIFVPAAHQSILQKQIRTQCLHVDFKIPRHKHFILRIFSSSPKSSKWLGCMTKYVCGFSQFLHLNIVTVRWNKPQPGLPDHFLFHCHA